MLLKLSSRKSRAKNNLPKKIFSFFLLFLFITSILFINNAKAYIIDTTYDFEDGTITHNYTSTVFNSKMHNTTNKFYIGSSLPLSGTKDFMLGAEAKNYVKNFGSWNYTYSSSMFIHLWEVYFKQVLVNPNTLFCYFYDVTGIKIIDIKIVVSGSHAYDFYYKNYLGTYVSFGFKNYYIYYKFGFIYNTNDSVTYYINGSSPVVGSPCSVVDSPKVKGVEFWWDTDANSGQNLYLDDARVVISDTLSGGGVAPSVFPSCSSQIGNLVSTSNSVVMPLGYSYLTYVYKVVSTFNISDYYVLMENVNPLISYQQTELKINNYNLGYPTSLINYGTTILLCWKNMSGIQIKGEMVYMCIKYPFIHPTTYDRHTFDKVNYDIDKDNQVYLTVHADTDYWNNFCNNENYRDYGIHIYNGYSPITEYFDLDYSFCYGYAQNIETHNYTNDLWVNPSIINVPNSVNIGYSLSSTGMLYSNYIKINKSGIEFYNQTLDASQQEATFLYRVLERGIYNVSLYQNRIKVKSIIFTATGSLNYSQSWIYTDLSTVKPAELFNIYYNYPYTTYLGIITYSKTGGSSQVIANINKNSSSHVSFSIENESLYIITLSANTGNSYIYLNSTSIIVVGSHQNKIYASTNSVTIPSTIEIYGEQANTGSDISVYRNGLFLKSVGNEPRFSFYDTLTISNTYIYTLVLKHGSTILVLDSVTVIASGTNPTKTEGGFSLWDYIQNLPLPVKVGLGLLLTLTITLLPLIIGILLSHTQIHMPDMVYMGFFFLGLGVSSALTLLPWTLFFIILFGLILYFIVQWLQRRS